VDAHFAQGQETGEHWGHFLWPYLGLQMGTMALVPQIVCALSFPVIAVGGIADTAGVRAALALGASGVQLGTVFPLCAKAATS